MSKLAPSRPTTLGLNAGNCDGIGLGFRAIEAGLAIPTCLKPTSLGWLQNRSRTAVLPLPSRPVLPDRPLLFMTDGSCPAGYGNQDAVVLINPASLIQPLVILFPLSRLLLSLLRVTTTAELQQRLARPTGTPSAHSQAMHPYPMQQSALGTLQKAPKRITITVPFAILDHLIERSGYEGRSISNLAAFLLEQALITRR